MRPNLFIVGAPKCGTSAWVEYLRSHPGVYFSPVKEPHHFCTDFPGFRTFPDRSGYEELFRESGSATVVGEASVMYLYSEVAANEIAAYQPDARIIIFVRRQEEFLPSLHNQILYNGDEVLEDFEQAWRLSGKREPPRSCRVPQFLDYVAQGRFYEQVMRYMDAFGREQVRVIHYDDWTKNPAAVYAGILEFLGLEHDGRTEFPRINKGKRHRLQSLGRFTQSPPRWALKLSRAAKKLFGGDRAPLVDKIRELNTTAGYRSSGITDELAEDIRETYAEDNRLLEPLIWRPALEPQLTNAR